MKITDNNVVKLLIPLLQTGKIEEYRSTNEENILRFIISFLQSFHIAYFEIDSFQQLRISLLGKIIVHNPNPEEVKEKLLWFTSNRERKTSYDMLVDFGLNGIQEYRKQII